MNIIWHGQSYFEIIVKNSINGDVKIAIDPYGEDLGIKPPKTEAHILLITHQHQDHNNKAVIKGQPFVIENPGEYEIKGVFVRGIPGFHDNQKGKERGSIVIYTIGAEDIKICHLGDLGQKELSSEQLEEISEVDILMIPVGGNYTIDAKDATEIVSQIEPRIVIPMHYKIPGLKLDIDGVEKFLKVMGIEGLEVLPKFKISAKDLPQEETEVVVLQP